MRWVTLAAALSLFPLLAEAQQARRPYRIGVLHEAWAANHPTVEGLKAGLRTLGFEESRDVTFDIRFTEGKAEVMPAAAAAFVKAGVDLLFTSGEAATQAARKATQKIPIVFTLVGDPIVAGIVKEVARPGGNVTGVSGLTTRLAPKRLEVLKTLVPNLRRVWAIYYADDPSSLAATRKAQEAAPLLRLELLARPVRTSQELASALQAFRPGDGLLPPEIPTLDIPAQILEMSLSARMPAVFPSAFWVSYGALISYGADYYAGGIQAAWIVAKILQGAQPQELPVEGAHRIELVINLKTTKALGVKIPQNVLVRADRMIQ
jgi:putative ABC transport system substrate-binding protein